MAFKFWTNTDGTGTWNAANFGGSLPANGDRVIFSGEYSNADLVAGLDRTTDTAGAGLYLDALEVRDDYEGDIGANGAPLTLGCKDVIYRGRGTMHIKGDGGSVERNLRNLVCDSSNLQDAVIQSNGPVLSNQPEIVVVASGHLQYAGPGSADETKHFICSPKAGAQAFLTIDSIPGVGTIVNNGGQVTCRCGVERFYHRGGTSIVNNANSLAGDEVHLVYQTDGLFLHNIPIAEGSVVQAHVMGGIFDMRRSSGNKTLNLLWKYYRGTVAYDVNVHNISAIRDLSGGEVNSD